MNGVIIIDKPQDFTSFDVVAVIRKICSTKKVGHTGTLDPMATGVLPVLLGNATKAQQFMPDHTKEYVADIKFGIETDTLDSTGNILSVCEKCISQDDISNIIPGFIGNIMQTPPAYSAIKIDGKKLYELAREGKTVDIPPRPVTIHELELLSFNHCEQTASIRVLCSSGTYIRSLCRDIGQLLGTCAVMSSLRRTRACGFELSQAYTIDAVRKLSDTCDFENHLIPTERLFESYSAVYITSAQAHRFKNGGSLALSRVKFTKSPVNGEIIRVFEPNSIFIGLAKVQAETDSLAFLKLF